MTALLASFCARFTCLCLLAAVGYGGMAVSAARASETNCGLQGEIRALAAEMRGLAWNEVSLTPARARMIGALASAADIAALNRRLAEADLAGRDAAVRRLLFDARLIAATRTLPAPDHMDLTIRALRRLNDQLCATGTGPQTGGGAGSGAARQVGTSGAAGMGLPSYGSSTRLMVLLVATCALVTLILVGQFAYRWIFALVYNRKSCRIYASVEIGLDVVEGMVTILGQKGCRFQPVNGGAFDRMGQLAGTGNAYLVIGTHRLPADIDGLYDYYAVMFFELHLGPAQQAALLRASTITPRYVPKTAPRSRNAPTPGSAPVNRSALAQERPQADRPSRH